METLLIQMSTTHEPFVWLVLGEQGDIMQGPAKSELSQLTALSESRRVVVLISGPEVYVETLKVPNNASSRIEKIIPFLLEEKLCADLESTHIALGAVQDGKVTAAVISKACMQTYLDELQQAGIHPSEILPACMTLPVNENDWHIVFEDELAYVNMAGVGAFATMKNNLKALLLQQLSKQESPSSIYMTIAEKQIRFTPDEINQLEVPAASSDQFFLGANVIQLELDSTINLLQGEFSLRSHQRPLKLASYTMAGLVGIWVMAASVLALITTLSLKHEDSELRQSIATQYRSLYPNAVHVVSPKLRISQELKLLQGNQANDNLISLMQRLDLPVATIKQLQISRAHYQNGALSLELTVASSEDLKALIERWQSKGLAVSSKNMISQDQQLKAKLIIRGGT